MKKTTTPSAVPEATPAPAKKAVRKTAAKKVALAAATPALPPAPHRCLQTRPQSCRQKSQPGRRTACSGDRTGQKNRC